MVSDIHQYEKFVSTRNSWPYLWGFLTTHDPFIRPFIKAVPYFLYRINVALGGKMDSWKIPMDQWYPISINHGWSTYPPP